MYVAHLIIVDEHMESATQEMLAPGITGLLVTDLLNEPEVTLVHVNQAHPTAGSSTMPGAAPVATGAHVEVSIIAGTNTAAEKATFPRDAYGLLADTLATVAPAGYVALYEPDAAA